MTADDFAPGAWVHPDEMNDDEMIYDENLGHYVRL